MKDIGYTPKYQIKINPEKLSRLSDKFYLSIHSMADYICVSVYICGSCVSYHVRMNHAERVANLLMKCGSQIKAILRKEVKQ